MEIIPIKSKYEKNGKVQIMYSDACKVLLLDKDELILPVDTSKNSFEVKGYYVTLNQLNKLQYRLLTHSYGYSGSFIAFTKFKDKVYMIEMSKEDFESKETKINCTLAEKDKIINGLKQPSTIILYEDVLKIFYANFPSMKKVKDEFNLETEDETLKRELDEQNSTRKIIRNFLKLTPTEDKADLENSDISIYGRQRVSIPVYAIKFLSDTKAVCNGLYVKMNGRDSYEISLNEIKIDLEKVLDNLKIQYALQWSKEDCLSDPDIITLYKANKKRKQIENGGNEKTL